MARKLWKVPKHIPNEQVWVYIDKKNYKKIKEMVGEEIKTGALKTLECIQINTYLVFTPIHEKSRYRYHG